MLTFLVAFIVAILIVGIAAIFSPHLFPASLVAIVNNPLVWIFGGTLIIAVLLALNARERGEKRDKGD